MVAALSLAVLPLALLAGPAAAQDSEQAVNADLIRLHDDLHLTHDQDAAWRAYTVAIKPSPDVEARRRAAEQLLPSIPTPRRIALVQAEMESDLADLQRQGRAVTAFYDKLTPAQQRTFDQETAPQPGADAPPSGPRQSSSSQVVTPPPSRR